MGDDNSDADALADFLVNDPEGKWMFMRLAIDRILKEKPVASHLTEMQKAVCEEWIKAIYASSEHPSADRIYKAIYNQAPHHTLGSNKNIVEICTGIAGIIGEAPPSNEQVNQMSDYLGVWFAVARPDLGEPKFQAPKQSSSKPPATSIPRIVSPFEFGALTGNGATMPPDIFDIYYGHAFDCVCGKSHTFGLKTEAPRILPSKQIVVACPDHSNRMTLLKIKGFFRMKGFQYVCGTKIDTESDRQEFIMGMGRGKGMI